MKTESNLKPQLQFEIEAFPKKEGEPCLVILYDNVAGPFEKQMGDENTQTYYTYDRYELETPYAENLEERISASFDSWLEKAKQEEGEEDLTEMEALKKVVADQQETIESMKSVIDDLLVFNLGGE